MKAEQGVVQLEPTTAGITVDTNTLRQRATEMAGRAAGQLADSARQTVTAPLEGLRSWGVGGEFLDSIITAITEFFSNIGTWISALFSGSSTSASEPAATARSITAPAAAAIPTPDSQVAPPAPTPQGAPQPNTNNRGATR